MMAASKTTIFAMAFTVFGAVLYAVCTELNLPLLTYHPVIGEIDFGQTPARSGPAMYWYGWMLTALIGTTVLGGLATLVPERWMQRTIMFATLAAVGYLIAYSLALFIYENATVELEFLKSRWLSILAGAVLAALLSLLVPASWNERLWPGWVWVIPLGAVSVLGYYLVPYFTR